MHVTPDLHLKGWGGEYWIANNDQYCGKILCVGKDKRCSLHFHIKKHETFYIIDGSIILEIVFKDGTKQAYTLQQGDAYEVPPGLMHRFTGVTNAKIMEVSTHHDEEDSYRVERGD